MNMNIIAEIERMNGEGHCISIIYDDNGNYAVGTTGTQNLPEEGEDLVINHFIEAKMFRETIAEAWEVFIANEE